jgi:hypothetical protein
VRIGSTQADFSTTPGGHVVSIHEPRISRLPLEGFKSRVDVLYVCADPLVIANRIRINSLSLGARLLTIYSYREYV